MSTLGDEGDIALVNPKALAIAKGFRAHLSDRVGMGIEPFIGCKDRRFWRHFLKSLALQFTNRAGFHEVHDAER